MGFNATRRYRDSKWHDIGLLAACVVITTGLVLWAVGVIG